MTEGVANIPKTRVELHVHLDGSIRHETIWELLKQKGLPLPGNGTFRDLQQALVVRDPVDLGHFLAPFAIFMPAVQDDLAAVERLAYEFGEDKARSHAAYVEARYSPYSFLTPPNVNTDNLGGVVAAVHRGFIRAEADFGIKLSSILATLIGNDIGEDILRMIQEHRDKNVVGIDLVGTYPKIKEGADEVPLNSKEQVVFERAASLGIHRTVHAGEVGDAEMVRRAVQLFRAERIGHGYRVLSDPAVYQECRSAGVHFECCPWSSFLTGTIPLGVRKHPIAVFGEDEVNFSLNTDNTAITGHTLDGDFELTRKWNFNEAIHTRVTMNAARSCFLPDDEKTQLIKLIKTNLGVDL